MSSCAAWCLGFTGGFQDEQMLAFQTATGAVVEFLVNDMPGRRACWSMMRTPSGVWATM